MKPEIMVSPDRVKQGEHVALLGTGFTPNQTLMSYLRRPDGSEFNPLRLRTDGSGAFSHRIDTIALDPGIFEVHAQDEFSKAQSNPARFTVISGLTDKGD